MDSTMNGLMTIIAFFGIIQGLGMKHSKAVRKKFMLDAKGVDKKYLNFKINFLITMGTVLLVVQILSYFRPDLGQNLNMLLSAFLLLAITSDMVYKKIRRNKSLKKK